MPATTDLSVRSEMVGSVRATHDDAPHNRAGDYGAWFKVSDKYGR
jgi:hypothetical protein